MVEGDARDEAVLLRALDGCDAVISSLGTGMSPFREVTLLSIATRAVVAAMTRSGVRRLVCIAKSVARWVWERYGADVPPLCEARIAAQRERERSRQATRETARERSRMTRAE